MSDIVRRSDYGSSVPALRVDRPTMKTLEALRGAALIREAQEYVAIRAVEQRLDGGYALADHAVTRQADLHRRITDKSRDEPGLELGLRELEQGIGSGAADLIYRFMRRPI